jgi:hypothetical protein
MSRRSTVLLVLIGAAIGMLLGYWFRGFLDRDKCLDAGGRWNVERGFCERILDREVLHRQN